MPEPGMPTTMAEDRRAVWLDVAILLTIGGIVGAVIAALVIQFL